jgi:hypothetical protein
LKPSNEKSCDFPERQPNKPTAREWPSSAFFEVVLPVELVYNQKQATARSTRRIAYADRYVFY